MVFHEVCSDLENIGYEVQAFIIPASGINAPHQRERLWIVAHTDNTRTNQRLQSNGEWKENDEQRRGQSQSEHWENGINGITSDSDNGCGSCDTVQTRREEFKKLYDLQSDATDSQNYGRKTDERINNGTKYKSNDRGTIRNIFNTDGKQRDVANSDLHGFHECNGNDEINASKRGVNALNDIDQSNGIGNATDTESQRTREQSSENRGREDGRFNDISEDGNAPDTNIKRLKEFNYANKSNGEGGQFDKKVLQIQNWDRFPTQSPVCGGDDGISHRLDNITFSKWRNESIKGYGNAVVPQVVYRIFKTIEYIQNLKP
jgi:DNA (cytosine-5)-methyltransferase 1